MEDTRFDDLAKVFGSTQTRRLTLGALLGGVISALGLTEADAKKKHKNNKKKKRKKNKCKNLGVCQVCQNKKPATAANGTACTPPGGGNGQCATQNGVTQCLLLPPPVPPAPPSPVCITLGNACTQTGTGAQACCAGTVCGRQFGGSATSFKCCNGPGTQCNATNGASCCTASCNTNTNPPTCSCKTAGTACDDNSQCCSNRCVTSGNTRTCA
jgi:hypothetical protein